MIICVHLHHGTDFLTATIESVFISAALYTKNLARRGRRGAKATIIGDLVADARRDNDCGDYYPILLLVLSPTWREL